MFHALIARTICGRSSSWPPKGCKQHARTSATSARCSATPRATRSPRKGYDPHFGARPLKRTIQRRIQNPLAMKLLRGEFKPGQLIEIEFEKGEFVFRVAKAREPAGVS